MILMQHHAAAGPHHPPAAALMQAPAPPPLHGSRRGSAEQVPANTAAPPPRFNAARLAPLNWASVASWFFRPPHTRPSDSAADNFIFAPLCTAIRCTVPSCSCECFTPGKLQVRFCESCKHGWVPHALDKLGFRHLYGGSQGQVEPVQPNVAFDIASLVLYGCQALPIRLKILLDRLFSVLQRDEVLQVLHGFGWTHDDYSRGYILQDPHGGVLDRWHMCTREEEPLVLQQFLRFGETRAITQQLLALDSPDLLPPALPPPPPPPLRNNTRPESASDIKKFIERSNRGQSPPPPSSNSLPPTSQAPIHLPPHSHGPPVPTQQRHPPRSMSPTPPPQSPKKEQLHPPRVPPPPPAVSQSSGAPALPPSTTASALSFLKLPGMGASLTNGPSRGGSSSPASSATSPLSLSPLNRLQSMQPIDFRKELAAMQGGRGSPDRGTRLPPGLPQPPHRRVSEASDTSPPGLNLSVSSPSCLPPMVFPGLGLAGMGHAAAFASLQEHGGGGSAKSEELSGCSDFGSDDENSQSALNLSRDRETSSDDKHLQRHHRKASTPMKRQWTPVNLGTQLINPATGKKRVQCNVCLKTFCDKGALKIHFSAVHLREMHKCTVEGCNMMFSSRRSRNRHSANPNPKLHSPHLRRKISPHDGRSANPHPHLLLPHHHQSLNLSGLNPLAAFNPMSSFPLLTPPPEMRQQHVSRDNRGEHESRERHLPLPAPGSAADLSVTRLAEDTARRLELGLHAGGSMSTSSVGSVSSDEPGHGDDGILTKRAKMSVSDLDDELSNLDSNDDSLSVDNNSVREGSADTPASQRGGNGPSVRKRKSQNPTRCALPQICDVDALSSDDSSNDVVFADESRDMTPQRSEQNDSEPKNEKLPASSPPPNNVGKTERAGSAERRTQDDESPVKQEPKEEKDEQQGARASPATSHGKVKSEKSTGSDDERESLDSSHALRQLENLSQGHFGLDMSTPLPFPLGLGLGLNHPPPPISGSTHGIMVGSPNGLPSPSHSPTECGGSYSNPDSPSGDSQSGILGGSGAFAHFRDTAALIGSMDVPIDKDNPRRCTACGKIFQNHFGVKTHYQNVHLKLMHRCTVDGCNAAFPSKRSRDRHSANLNLHRKLLSTSSDKSGLFMDKSPFTSLAANPALHSEFLARLYADSALNLDSYKNYLPPGLAEQLMNGDRLSLSHGSPHHPLLLPGLGLPGGFGLGSFGLGMNGRERHLSSGSEPPSSPASPPPSPVPPGTPQLLLCLEEDLPTPDREGHLPCRFCRIPMRDGGSLKEHYEQVHLNELHRCTSEGCAKVFVSRKTRATHMAGAHAATIGRPPVLSTNTVDVLAS